MNQRYRLDEAEAMEDVEQSIVKDLFRPWKPEGLQRQDSAHSDDAAPARKVSKSKSKTSKEKALAAKARAEAREREKASSQG